MRISFSILLITGCAVSATAQYKNNKVGEACTEPSIAFNAENPKNIVISTGTNQVSYSNDSGVTWTTAEMKPSFEIKGNGILCSSDNGEIYYVYSTETEVAGKKVKNVACRISRTSGKTWNLGVLVNDSPNDKLMPIAFSHPDKGTLAVAWSEMEKEGSQDPACKSHIMYSQSSQGEKWSDPLMIDQTPGDCANQDNTLRDPMLGLDDGHKVFASWQVQSSFLMDRSYDAGKTWLNSDMAGFKLNASRDYKVPGLQSTVRKLIMTADNSHCIYKNSLYMVWSDQQNGPDDTDVWFATSARRGDSWLPTVKVNQDGKGKHQFMPAIAVDPKTGVIYIVYYDRRNYTDNQTDVYLAYSGDGGDKWKEIKISETPFTPTEDKPFVNRISIAALNGIIVPVWVRMDGGVTSVMTTVVKQADIIEPIDLPKNPVAQKKKVQPLQRHAPQQGIYRSPIRRQGQY